MIYFYPKDDTLVCTREACRFRDADAAFSVLGASVIGISADGPGSHLAFARRHRLPFKLLSDPGDAAFRAFGLKKFLGFKERATFVVDAHGTVQAVVTGRLSAAKHVRRALEALQVQRLANS